MQLLEPVADCHRRGNGLPAELLAHGNCVSALLWCCCCVEQWTRSVIICLSIPITYEICSVRRRWIPSIVRYRHAWPGVSWRKVTCNPQKLPGEKPYRPTRLI